MQMQKKKKNTPKNATIISAQSNQLDFCKGNSHLNPEPMATSMTGCWLDAADEGRRFGSCFVRMHIQISMTPNTKDLPGVKSSSPSLSTSVLVSELLDESPNNNYYSHLIIKQQFFLLLYNSASYWHYWNVLLQCVFKLCCMFYTYVSKWTQN